MPVSLEVINRPDAADLADLEKIYADYPVPPTSSFENWLDMQRETGAMLIAGRFNGRLLGALWLTNNGRIEHLCVRALTRRRGTARQLLQLLQSHATQLQISRLHVVGGEELSGLWQSLNFKRDDSGWVWLH
ncbi:MAG: putative acetyltransferase [Verrucomicrobiaceae bacterium]|nr:putative acetyltransferase [Verrucomicrobiaceae bacterium]